MGSPLSPVIADIYMEHLIEDEAISTVKHQPSTWFQYVDDTFVVWPHGIPSLEDFLTHINSLRPTIKFTMETEQNGKLPFLDVLVCRNGEDTTTMVYRKPTHTDRYLNFRSNHHPKTKIGIIKCLAHRAKLICNPKHITKEMEHLEKVFVNNNYPKS